MPPPPRDSAVPVPSTTGPDLRHPHSLEAERQVLGALLLDNDVIDDVIDDVRPEDFYAPAHQLVFQAIIDLHGAGQPVEITLLVDELRRTGKLDQAGGHLYLAQLEQEVLSTGAAPEHARLVAEKATLRRLMAAADAILREAAEERRPAAEALDVAEKLIFEVSRETRSTDFRTVHDLMDGAMEEVRRLLDSKGAIPGVPTHFPDLDKLLNGLNPSDLLILAARPSIGKTAFALNLALNIATLGNRPVGVFSLEMGAEQLNMRLLTSHSRIGASLIRRGGLEPHQLDTLRKSATRLAQAPIFIDDTPGISLLQLRTRARRLRARHDNLALIVVDYLQLMTMPEARRREANRQQEVSEISRGLKGLARELNVPVLALSQLSRTIEQRSTKKESARPMLSDLRESGAIEQDADIVMFVHRERAELEKDETGKNPNRGLPIPTEIIVGKHRNGPTGIVNLMFFPEFTLFGTPPRN